MWLLVLSLLIQIHVHAEPVTVDIPVVDAPFNFLNGVGTGPSMSQSLALSSAYYEVAHRAILGDGRDRRLLRTLGVVGFDLLSTYVPFGDSWLHEEWHRAVLSRRDIASFNDVYNLPFGQSTIAVSHVTDDDLIRLKANHPAEQVRLSSAGMESQVAQNLFLEQHQFYRQAPANNRLLLWLNNFSVFGYLSTCASSEANTSTDDLNSSDGSNIPKRDFTGLDCTAWVYDLFRPDEPYSARGVHPSGVGVDRYIKYSDLTASEQSFLKRQVWLSLLNFVDPFLFGWDSFGFKMGDGGGVYNARLSHQLTSFGYTVDTHLFLKTVGHRFQFILHSGFNDKAYFPGVTGRLLHEPLTENLFLTSGLTLWSEPDGQRFDSRGGSLLASAELEASYKMGEQSEVYLGLDTKTPGWLSGQVFLDRAFNVRTGFRAGVF